MAQNTVPEADFYYVLSVLAHSSATLDTDWYGVAGIVKGPNQDRGPANRAMILKHSELTPDWWAIGAEHYKVKTANKGQKDYIEALATDWEGVAKHYGYARKNDTTVMARQTDPDENVKFMALVISQSDISKIDWKVVCAKTGYSRPDKPQQKFKKLIESTGKYALVNGKVVDLEEDSNNPNPAPATPAKRGRGGKAAGTPRTTGGRKRKTPAKEKDTENEDSEGEAEETPVKKRATTKRGAAKAAAKKVKEDSSENDEEAEPNGNGNGGDKSGDDGAEKSDGEGPSSSGDANPDEV